MTSNELMTRFGTALFNDSEKGKVLTLKIVIGILCKDILDTAKERGAKTDSKMSEIIQEKNDTWNAFTRLYNKKYPKAKVKLKKDALKIALEEAIENTGQNH